MLQYSRFQIPQSGSSRIKVASKVGQGWSEWCQQNATNRIQLFRFKGLKPFQQTTNAFQHQEKKRTERIFEQFWLEVLSSGHGRKAVFDRVRKEKDVKKESKVVKIK